MFRFHKTKDVVTLFHKSGMASSMRVQALLKQLSAEATETATTDQASDHSAQQSNRSEFELDVMEEPPTQDQLRSILGYVGSEKARDVVEGATSVSDAVKRLEENKNAFKYPVTVDWENGKAVIGDSESEIMKLIRNLPTSKKS